MHEPTADWKYDHSVQWTSNSLKNNKYIRCNRRYQPLITMFTQNIVYGSRSRTLLSRIRSPLSASICLSKTITSSGVTFLCLPATWTTANSRPASCDTNCSFILFTTVTKNRQGKQTDVYLLRGFILTQCKYIYSGWLYLLLKLAFNLGFKTAPYPNLQNWIAAHRPRLV